MLKLLPIGTVVRLKDAKIPFMIAGYFGEDPDSPGYLYDYSAFPYPLGFSSTVEASFLDEEDIEGIIAMGYQDQEQMKYVKKLESFQPEVQNGEETKDDQ